MAYLLDTDVFIRAKNEHYGFELCPGFWEWLEAMNAAGAVKSVEAIYHELIGGDGDLAQWARDHRSFFLPPTATDVANKTLDRANRTDAGSSDFDGDT